MKALKLIGAIVAAYLVMYICFSFFGPPGLALAIAAIAGWVYAQQSGMSLGTMARALFRR